MPLFQYQALSDRGKKFTATIDADSLQEAKMKLVKRQVAVLKLDLLHEKQMRDRLSAVDLLNLTREIGRLLQAGIPLFEALSALEEKYRRQKGHRLLLNLCDLVKSGSSFSEGLNRHRETFDLLYISMVANAEKTGRLAEALQELAELLLRQQKIRKQVVSALLYPGLLLGFCCVVLSSLLFYVVPSLKELFDGRNLHPLTQVVFSVSAFACRWKALLALLLLGAVTLGGVAIYSKRWRGKILEWSFRLPFFKTLAAKVAFVRFCRACATLLEGGLPLIQTFEQARLVMRHPSLEEVVTRAAEKISQGVPIHVPFENHPLIPSLIPRMIAIAEEGGKLPFMMQQIAQIYEEELEKTLSHFATVAQPVLLLILGTIIGFVLLSVLLPLTDVSSFSTV